MFALDTNNLIYFLQEKGEGKAHLLSTSPR